MLTVTQVAAIIMLLQAFGVSQPVIDTVRAEITPTAQIAPTSPVSAGTSQNTTGTITPVAPVLGATQPCVSTPVFDFTVTVVAPNVPNQSFTMDTPNIPIPSGATAYMDGNVIDSCTQKNLVYPEGFGISGESTGVWNNGYRYEFGYHNNVITSTTTASIVLTSMGQTATTTFLRLPE